MRCFAFFLAASLVAARLPAQQQTLQVTEARPLAFGTLIGGIPTIAARTDPARAGQFNLVGTPNSQVTLMFTLPASLITASGAAVPLFFGAGDAGYSAVQAISNQTSFDPSQPYTATLSPTGRGSVYLGGRARPARNQAPDSYTAEVVLTVAYVQ